MPNKVATLRLLGVYKGSDLKKHNLSFKQNEPIRYLKSIKAINEEDISTRSKGMKTLIENDVFVYDPLQENKNQYLPIHTKAKHIHIIHDGHKDYKCQYCGNFFSEAGNLRQHMNKVHKLVHRG